MSAERHVMALLEEGNPAPELGDEWTHLDAATYLATLEQRISEMTKLETNESQQDTPRQWNRPWLIAAVFVFVLGVGAFLFNQMNPASVAGPPAIPLEGAEDHPGAAEAFSAVEAAYHLFNTGDPAWTEIWWRGSDYGPSPEELEADRELFTVMRAVDPRYDVSGCVSKGSGEWDIVDAGVPTPTGYYFVCETFATDRLLEVAGVYTSESIGWVVDDSSVMAVQWGRDTEEDLVFHSAFGQWLASNHPEAADFLDAPAYGFDDPETRSQILDYAEEFVAQSDVYPLESSDS